MTDALAANPPDFAVTKDGLSLSIFSLMPKPMQGLVAEDVPFARKDIEPVRVHPSPVDALWKK